MAPEKIRVKLVSEAAEYVTVTHVVQRDFTLTELVELVLPVVGTDPVRIRHIIRAGTVSTGEYRYRWEGWEVAAEDLDSILETVPRAEPLRELDLDRCSMVRFRRGTETLDLPRSAAARKALFSRQSFWEGLSEMAAKAQYLDYSHVEKADIFSLSLDADAWQFLRGLLPLLKPKSAADRLERMHPDRVEWLLSR